MFSVLDLTSPSQHVRRAVQQSAGQDALLVHDLHGLYIFGHHGRPRDHLTAVSTSRASARRDESDGPPESSAAYPDRRSPPVYEFTYLFQVVLVDRMSDGRMADHRLVGRRHFPQSSDGTYLVISRSAYTDTV